MFSQLKEVVEERQPLPNGFLLFSHPDSMTTRNNILAYFRVALYKSGLQDFGAPWNQVESMFALSALGRISRHILNDTNHLVFDNSPFIVLHYSRSSLTTTIVPDEFPPTMVKDHLHLGANSTFRKKDSKSHWNEVRAVIENLMRGNLNKGEVVILGSQGNDARFLRTVQSVIEENQYDIKFQSPTEHVFASARGAAMFARMGMKDSMVGCLPNPWCASVEEDTSTQSGTVKAEL
jgi:hypothetical protein